MTPGGQSPYPNLRFASHTDWKHVNPYLLQVLQKVAQARGETVDVISGYRDNKYSSTNGGFAGDPHTKGIAVDAYIGGKPIGDVIPASTWKTYGVRSGNSFTYKGKTDPEHLDLLNWNGVNKLSTDAPAAPTPTPNTAPDTSGQPAAPTANTALQDDISAIPQLPGPPVAGVALAGTFDPTPATSQASPTSTWQLIASQGQVSPETLRLAGLAGYGDGTPTG